MSSLGGCKRRCIGIVGLCQNCSLVFSCNGWLPNGKREASSRAHAPSHRKQTLAAYLSRNLMTNPPVVDPSRHFSAAALTTAALLATGMSAQSWQPLAPQPLPIDPDALATTATTAAGLETLVVYDQVNSVTLIGPLWAPIPTPAAPPSRNLACMDGSSAQTVLFGGIDTSGVGPLLPTDTWTLVVDQVTATGTWTQVPSPTSPAGRILHSMASVPGGDVFLFGGVEVTGPIVYGDFWRFGGGAWTQVFPIGPAPTPRAGALLSAGPNGSLVLFGGEDRAGTILNDTWVFSPGFNAWRLATTPISPPPRAFGGMAFDAARNVVVMSSGINRSDTWELSDVTGSFSWRQLPVATAPSGPLRLLRDPVLGGIRSATDPNPVFGVPFEEWLFRPSPLNLATFPATPWTCSTTLGTLRLQPASLPILGTSFNMNVLNADPGAGLLGLFELLGPRIPIPFGGGCFGFLVGGGGLNPIANQGFSSPWSVPLANSPAGVGLQIDFQVLHVSGNPAQFRTTQVVAATLGF